MPLGGAGPLLSQSLAAAIIHATSTDYSALFTRRVADSSSERLALEGETAVETPPLQCNTTETSPPTSAHLLQPHALLWIDHGYTDRLLFLVSAGT